MMCTFAGLCGALSEVVVLCFHVVFYVVVPIGGVMCVVHHDVALICLWCLLAVVFYCGFITFVPNVCGLRVCEVPVLWCYWCCGCVHM